VRRLLVTLALAACSANDDFPAPLISSLTPDHGPAGAVITINGSYFCQKMVGEDPICNASGTVDFGTVPATLTSYTDTALMVEVPSAATGATSVTVTAAGKTSNGATFTIE